MPCPCQRQHSSDFYPRSPCGERLGGNRKPLNISKFLSTLSLRRATIFGGQLVGHGQFLSTLSLRRATKFYFVFVSLNSVFLSTLSLRRATVLAVHLLPSTNGFLSTLSLRRATRRCICLLSYTLISIHALLAESDPCALFM